MPIEVRPINDEIDQFVSIAGESLLSNERSSWQLYVDRIGAENLRGVYHDAELVGGMGFYRMGQWFGGRELPAAGFSGVAINPAHRGSGACASMLKHVLRELHRESVPIASLYASTQRLYRGVGFEQAGSHWQYSIPISSVPSDGRHLPARRYESAPLDQLAHVARQRAARGNGHLTRTDGLWQRLLEPYDTLQTLTYVLGDASAPEGYAILKPGTRQGGVPQTLVSTDVAANTPAAFRRLATLIHDHRSMNDRFQWFGGPNDAFLMLAQEQHVTVQNHVRWMLRIIDLPAALGTRGYPEFIEGEIHLDVQDDLLVENAGRWILHLSGGRGHLVRGGEGSLKLSIRSLAPLFSSLYSASELSDLGLLEAASESQRQITDRAFAGPSPWVSELF